MPEYIPALPNMEICHLLSVNFAYFNNLSGIELATLQKIIEWRKIHEIAGIDTDINPVYKMNTLLIPPNSTKISETVTYYPKYHQQ
jgi:hypothetical protein